MKKRSITKAVVDAAQPAEKDYLVWDTRVTGFGLRVRQSGAKYYVVKYRLAGRQRWVTVGKHGAPWTPDTARQRAMSILGDASEGKDSAAIRDKHKSAQTVEDLAEIFMEQHVRAKRKPRTAGEYQSLVDRFIIPALGKLRPGEIEHTDVLQLHYKMRKTPRQANHMLAVLSKMFSWSHKPNPCLGIDRYPEGRRERFLSQDELSRLGAALAEAEAGRLFSPWVIAAIRMLIFTGARRNEILELRWQDVDMENAVLQLPESKTGQRTIYLNPPALQVLETVPRVKSNPFVLCGTKRGRPIASLQNPWERIRKIAGLEDCRLHDLRHSYASIGTVGGLNLQMVGKLLGHRNPTTTARYSHLADDPARAANQAIGQRIAAAMKGDAGAEVVELKNRNR